jgi:hypothetical protein
MKKTIILSSILMFISCFVDAQEFYDMQQKANEISAKKKFVLQYKMKSVKSEKICPKNPSEYCDIYEGWSDEEDYDTEGNLTAEISKPYAFAYYETKYTYKNKNLIKKAYWWANDFGDYHDSTIYKYDASGNILQAERCENKTWTKKIYTYDFGKLSGIEFMEKDSNAIYYSSKFITFVYDSTGILREEIHKSTDGEKEKKYTYSYNDKGNFLKIERYLYLYKITTPCVEFEYNSSGDTTMFSYLKKNEDTEKILCEYNSEHQKTKTYGKSFKAEYTYTYNGLGQRIVDEETSDGIYWKTIYYYNDNGLIWKKLCYDKDDTYIYGEKYTYEFYE